MPGWTWVLMLVGGAVLLVPCIGIVAAIAIPSLLRARVAANEAAAIGHLRAFGSAQAAYAAASGGTYGSPACLLQPAPCLPPGTAARAPFLPAEQAPGARRGYEFEFHAGPSAATGLTGYAYTARPLAANRTGVRSFCIDAAGAVCSVGRSPEARSWTLDGACPRDCQPL